MNIAIISPHAVNNGNTTVASLIALELSSRGKKVCLTHTTVKSVSLYNYFGLSDVEDDKTANPARLIKMIQEKIIKTEEIRDYCKSISPDMEIFSSNDVRFKQDDLVFLIDFIARRFPHEYVVFDMDDNDLSSRANQVALKHCDFVVVVMTQSVKEVDSFRKNAKSIFKAVGNKPMCMVINNYSSTISKVKDISTALGIKDIKKASSWLYIRYNPFIVKYENKGDLYGFYRALRNNDYRIVDIAEDIKSIVNRIMKFKRADRALKVAEALGARQDVVMNTDIGGEQKTVTEVSQEETVNITS